MSRHRLPFSVSRLLRGRALALARPVENRIPVRFCSTVSNGPVGQMDMKAGKIMMIFTCDVCNERTAKLMSRRAHEHGVVIVQCPSCKNRHLIADNLGWFGEGKQSLEDILKKKGKGIRRSWESEDFQLSPEDLNLAQEVDKDLQASIADEHAPAPSQPAYQQNAPPSRPPPPATTAHRPALIPPVAPPVTAAPASTTDP